MTSTPAADEDTTASDEASPTARRRRVLISSTVGSTIEWYDFYLYSTAAALVLGPLFLPTGSAATSTLAAFGTYAAGFVARPLGGLVAGHLGDRIGRKTMLVVTVMVMGVATVGIGLLPTYDQIGVAAPILLVTLRVLQGVGIGGEWGGAVLLAVEHAPPGRRGLYGSWPQVGFPAGLFLGTVAFTAVSQLPDEQFLAWGWRLPFLASALLVIVGLVIRLRVADSPEFTTTRARGELHRQPLRETLRRHPRRVTLGILVALGHGLIVTLFTVWLLSYASGPDGDDRTAVLTGLMIAAAAQCVAIPLFGALTDRIGYRPVLLGGYTAGALALIPGLLWAPTGSVAASTVTFALAMTIGHGAVYAAIAGHLCDRFPTSVRFSAVSLTYQLGSTLSSFGPLLAAAVVTSTDSVWPVAAIAVVVAAAAAWAAAHTDHPTRR